MLVRAIRGHGAARQGVRMLHSGRVVFQKKHKNIEPIYDDAEVMSDRLSRKPYYAKREGEDYEMYLQERRAREEEYEEGTNGENGRPDREPEEERLTPEQIKKQNERIEGIKGLIQGILGLGLMFGGFELYQKYPMLRNKWYKQEGDEFVPPKKKKKTVELPPLTDKNDSSVPGLYIWGDNQNNITSTPSNAPWNRWPLRHPWFNGKYLQDVNIGEKSALAIDDKGDLIQWGDGYKPKLSKKPVDPEYTIKGERLVRATLSNGAIYALNKKNEILIIPESAKDQSDFKDGIKRRNWFFRTKSLPFTKLSTDKLFQKGEDIVDFQTGKVHLVVLTNKGRAFSTTTGLEDDVKLKSEGQFGLLQYSHFGKAPPVNQLFDIEMLNNSIEKNSKGAVDHIEQRFITKISTGNYHTLALDSNGEVYTFGQNTFGQLGHPVNYDTQFITIPRKMNLLTRHVSRDLFPEAIDIKTAGDTSFVTVKPASMFKLVRNMKGGDSRKREEESFEQFTVGFGSNLKGQIGNNHYVHAQFEPFKIKELQKFEDFNESKNEMEKIGISTWSSGQDHTFIKLDNHDVLYWGGNDFGELGNGKKNRIPKPSPPPALIEPGFTQDTYKDLTFVNRLQLKPNQEIIASGNASAIFYKK